MNVAFPKKVLIVRLGAIGDVVNALVFATAIKDEHPGTEIGWAIHPLVRPIVEGHPSVDRVHLWERGGGVAEFWRVVRELRVERYELAVDLQRITKSALLARFSGAPRILGYDRARAKEASWLWTKERIAPGPPTAHMVEHYLEFARHLGLTGANGATVRHVLPVDDQAEAWANALVDELGGAPILVNLGATKPANRWLPERFGELALALHEAFDAPVCYTGSAADRALERGARAVSDGNPGVSSVVGESDLRQLCSLARRARLFVACDTGPMHIAVACGAPVVALFGPADPDRTGPFQTPGREQHVVVRAAPPCAPCNRKTCNQPRHACMEDIDVEQVVAAARGVPSREPELRTPS